MGHITLTTVTSTARDADAYAVDTGPVGDANADKTDLAAHFAPEAAVVIYTHLGSDGTRPDEGAVEEGKYPSSMPRALVLDC